MPFGNHTLRFESVPDPATGGGYMEPPAPDPEPEPAWAPSQEDWDRQQSQLQALAQYVEQQQAAQHGDQLGPPPDPSIYPQEFAQWLDQRDQQRLGRYDSFIDRYETNQGRELMMDVIADREAADGEFLVQPTRELPVATRDIASMFADNVYPDMVTQYGDRGSRASEAALSRGYEMARQYEDAVGKAYLARQQHELNTLRSAPRPPGPTGVGAAQAVASNNFGSEMDVVRHHTGGYATGR